MEIPEKMVPEEVELVESTRREEQEQAREIDRMKRLADPGYKGAFHEKKKRGPKNNFDFNPKSKHLRGKKKPRRR
jgi:ATP-dependent RNA helicase RhlE